MSDPEAYLSELLLRAYREHPDPWMLYLKLSGRLPRIES
jgi:hypothetical protein